MEPYHKIPTVFKRDPTTKHKTLIDSEFATAELEYLADTVWLFTEKIDGTNVRVIYEREKGDGVIMHHGVYLNGRKAKSILPSNLEVKLRELFPIEKFVDLDLPTLTLYGEGYGSGIQKVGKFYNPDGVDFIVFDIRIGDYWLERNDVVDIAYKLGVKVVPLVNYGSLLEGVELAREGFRSRISDVVRAEGLIMKPRVQMFDRAGKRIIAKIKTRDFIPSI